jgi:hypothetical protein
MFKSFSKNVPAVKFFDTPSNGVRSYYRVIIEGTNTPFPQVEGSAKLSGNMIAISNPIYFNFDPKF